MHKQTTPLFALTLLLLFASAGAADKPVEFARADLSAADSLRQRALSDSTAHDLVSSLTTEVGTRPSGSAGDKAAVAWGLREMRRLGFENVRAEPVTVPHWVRGEAQFAVIAPYPLTMPTLALGGSIGTPAEGLEAEAI